MAKTGVVRAGLPKPINADNSTVARLASGECRKNSSQRRTFGNCPASSDFALFSSAPEARMFARFDRTLMPDADLVIAAQRGATEAGGLLFQPPRAHLPPTALSPLGCRGEPDAPAPPFCPQK